MVTSIGTGNDRLEMLQDLIRLDHAAVEAYQAAIERLDNDAWRQQLASFRNDHQRHIDELGPVVRQLGGEVPIDAGAKQLLAEGKVALGGLMDDTAILKAMRSNEADTNTAYERVAEKAPPEARDIVQRGLSDERRHCDWILAQLDEDTTTLRTGQHRDTHRSDYRGGL